MCEPVCLFFAGRPEGVRGLCSTVARQEPDDQTRTDHLQNTEGRKHQLITHSLSLSRALKYTLSIPTHCPTMLLQVTTPQTCHHGNSTRHSAFSNVFSCGVE